MRQHGVTVDAIRAADHDIATGVYPDMTGHGAATDAWPELYSRVLAADILVLAGPIWLGDNSSVMNSLQHLGYTIPPQADAGWIGAVGPGPSYLDDGSGGPDSDFTNRNTTFLTFNLMHVAAMLERAGGFPAYGNQRSEWDAGCSPGQENPEHR